MDKINFIAGLLCVVIGGIYDNQIVMLAGIVIINIEYAMQRIMKELKK